MSFLHKQNWRFPHLLETQYGSFCRFLERGIGEELLAIANPKGTTEEARHVVFLNKRFSETTTCTVEFKTNEYYFKPPKESPTSAVEKIKTYDVELIVPTIIRFPRERISYSFPSKICNLPLITNSGHFVINGSSRIVVHQIVRSPGVYATRQVDKVSGIKTFTVSFLSFYGSWIRFEVRMTERRAPVIYVKIDRLPKIPVTLFLQALGFSESDLQKAVYEPKYLKSGQVQTTTMIEGILENSELAHNIVMGSQDAALEGIVSLLFPTRRGTSRAGTVFLHSTFFNPRYYSLGLVGRKRINAKLGMTRETNELTLTPEDLLAGLDMLTRLQSGHTHLLDDIDHLKNRRIRLSGELIQTQFRLGLNRWERVLSGRGSRGETLWVGRYGLEARFYTPDRSKVVLSKTRGASIKKPRSRQVSFLGPIPTLRGIPLLSSTMGEFFGLNPMSQFMDQTNPLAEVTHKRRLSSLGPGGLHRDRAGLIVRSIHPSYYGRVCPIETPEGKNAGLVGSLASYAQLNPDGFILVPYNRVKYGQFLTDKDNFSLLPACYEDEIILASFDVNLQNSHASTRLQGVFDQHIPKKIDYFGVSPIQFMSIATSLIPFLEHDDANRALMGSNMQRQAVSLVRPERAFIGTGGEGRVTRESGALILAKHAGYVTYADAQRVNYIAIIENEFGDKLIKPQIIHLAGYRRSNQDSCLCHRPAVEANMWVEKGECLADNTATFGGELALGRNILVGYMPWEGYNFEDAVLVSERLVSEDIFTSIHIERYDIETRRLAEGDEYFTCSVENGEYLDELGIVKVGVWVETGDVLVGKISPQGSSETTPEQKLLRAIFSVAPQRGKETSFRVSNGVSGRIFKRYFVPTTKSYFEDEGTEWRSTGKVYIYVVQKRRLQVGDKVAGRHGNKGIISNILPRSDMPFVQSGLPLDMVLNPLGVPSRMNVGQIFECLLGLAAKTLKKNFKVVPFDEMHGEGISRGFVYQYLYEARLTTQQKWIFRPNVPGKTIVFDGRTGLCFDQPVTVGYPYILKLVHLVDDKIHARATGPYSMVTQQPLGGRSKHGGQRLGEMEVWALEGFGAAYTLQELLTIKSDDMNGRTEAFMAMIRGTFLPKPGIPESFKVLVSELRGLCLKMTISQVR